MDAEFLTIGLASLGPVWAIRSFPTGTPLAFSNAKCPLALTLNEKEVSTKILDLEGFLGAVLFMQTYKILVLILVG